ncbi:MAG: hydroxysqualene dehydroxylase HpnE [Pseudomonadota bacterium]
MGAAAPTPAVPNHHDGNGIIHIVGAGLSGLACAVRLVSQNPDSARHIHLYEGANHAGGRCRTFHDSTLDCEIDNGNHLMMAANTAVLEYAGILGTTDTLVGPPETVFPFVDLQHKSVWALRPNAGRVPWWMLVPSRRVPNTSISEYLDGVRLMRAGPERTVSETMSERGELWRSLWEPLTIGVLNASPDEGSASLLGRVFKETFGKGGAACKPIVAATGLSHSLIDPAIAYLKAAGVTLHFGARLKALQSSEPSEDQSQRPPLKSLRFADRDVSFGAKDHLVAALPCPVTAALIPSLTLSDETRAIVNLHFRLPSAPVLDNQHGMPVPVIGMVGSVAQWLFIRDEIVSVTISAADALAQKSADEIARMVWNEVAQALEMLSAENLQLTSDLRQRQEIPPVRIVKEKRATFLQTPEIVSARPKTDSAGEHITLAGDWTDTGLPATIEGSIRSGFAAADRVLSQTKSKSK